MECTGSWTYRKAESHLLRLARKKLFSNRSVLPANHRYLLKSESLRHLSLEGARVAHGTTWTKPSGGFHWLSAPLTVLQLFTTLRCSDSLTGLQVDRRPSRSAATTDFSYVNGHVIITIICTVTGGDLWFCPIGSDAERVSERAPCFPCNYREELWLICGLITVAAAWLSDAAGTWRIICGKSITLAVITFTSLSLFPYPFNEKTKSGLKKKLRSKLSYRYSQILILCTCTRSLRHCVIVAIVGQTGGRSAIDVFLDREDVAPTARFSTLGKIKN